MNRGMTIVLWIASLALVGWGSYHYGANSAAPMAAAQTTTPLPAVPPPASEAPTESVLVVEQPLSEAERNALLDAAVSKVQGVFVSVSREGQAPIQLAASVCGRRSKLDIDPCESKPKPQDPPNNPIEKDPPKKEPEWTMVPCTVTDSAGNRIQTLCLKKKF